MSEFNVDTNCGKMKVEIDEKENDEKIVYSVSVQMKNFGQCQGYCFIAKSIERMLNDGKSLLETSSELKEYECNKGPNGCIKQIGNCLEFYHHEIEEMLYG